MVTLIWFLLSLFGVCVFNWWPMLIEALVLLILTAVVTLGHPGQWASYFMLTMAGFLAFALGKLFCGLTLSPLWLVAAPVWSVVALVIPGGYTIGVLVLKQLGVMTLPTWIFWVALAVDAFSLNQIVKRFLKKE